jgi:hypothetical protein
MASSIFCSQESTRADDEMVRGDSR